jgi:kynurenine formamidase
LNAAANYWPGEKYSPFQIETIATLEKDGVLSKKLSFPEHIGTHLDAPNHFEAGQMDVSEIPASQLIVHAVKLNIAPQCESNPDYQLTVKDIENWEREQGVIPQRAVVLLETGWGRFWSTPERFQGRDAMGVLHFPGYSADAARFLVSERRVRGLGIDTLSVDPGASKAFETHHILNRGGRYALENVAALDQLPPRGFTLCIAPLKVTSGTGGPCRIYAILPETKPTPIK